MTRIITLSLAVALALPLMAADKKAEPAKAEQKTAPQTKQLSASQVYALQKASEDVQRAQETLKAAQQTLSTVGMSIQQDCGCRITQQSGKLVGIVEAPVKK